MGAGGVAGQGVVEVAEGDGWGGADGFLEAAGEAVAEIDAYLLTPDVSVAGLVGIGSGDEECAGEALAGFAETAAVAGFDGHEQFAVGCGGEDAEQAVVSHRLRAAEV